MRYPANAGIGVARLKRSRTADMGDDNRKNGPRKGKKGEVAERGRRRREAEQLRANLLKRKEQSRSRPDRKPPPGNPGKDPGDG